MEFSLNRSDLLEPLAKVVGVLEKRQTLPILSHVLLSVEAERVTLCGTDQEVELKTQVDFEAGTIQVQAAGRCAVPGRKLLEICRHLPADAELSFSLSDARLTLTSGAFESQFSTLPAEEFPSLDGYQPPQQMLTVNAVDLGQMLGKSAFAMAQQDVRYFFNGMLFELEGLQFKVVATNGQRLAVVASNEAMAEHQAVGRPIVPRKGVLELVKLLDGVEGEVDLGFSDTSIVAQMTGKRFVSKLIDGEYPDYTKAIPDQPDKRVTCDRGLLRDALIRTAVMSNEVYKNVKLSLQEDKLMLFTNNPLQEQAEESLSVEYQGEALDIGFNIHFLIEALGAMSGKNVSMGFSGQTSPCLITDPDDAQATFVVSPMVI